MANITRNVSDIISVSDYLYHFLSSLILFCLFLNYHSVGERHAALFASASSPE